MKLYQIQIISRWIGWDCVFSSSSFLHFKFLESLLVIEHDVVVEDSEATGVEDHPAGVEIQVDYIHHGLFFILVIRNSHNSRNSAEDEEGNFEDDVGIDKTRHDLPHSNKQQASEQANNNKHKNSTNNQNVDDDDAR